MKNRLKLTLLGILFLNNWANAQSVETKLQFIIDSIYSANPTSIGIMVHVESPENNISWSGSIGYSNVKDKIELMPDQPALIASSIKPYISATILRLQELKKLSIEEPIIKHLTKKTIDLFESDGYELDQIKIKHLLSHTSGVEGYDNMEFLDWVGKNPNYRWTRDRLLEEAIKVGNPLGKPEDVYKYADANYLLCTEIIEVITNKPFYESIRELLKYDEFNFTNTWFPTLEDINTKSLIHQYWGAKNWDSYNIDISWDLYGGGGIATTTKEVALFYYKLFNGEIIVDSNILNQIYTKIETKDGQDKSYFLGVSEGTVKDYKSYGHGGFWGNLVLYIPEIDVSIAVFVSERDKGGLRKEIIDKIVGILIE